MAKIMRFNREYNLKRITIIIGCLAVLTAAFFMTSTANREEYNTNQVEENHVPLSSDSSNNIQITEELRQNQSIQEDLSLPTNQSLRINNNYLDVERVQVNVTDLHFNEVTTECDSYSDGAVNIKNSTFFTSFSLSYPAYVNISFKSSVNGVDKSVGFNIYNATYTSGSIYPDSPCMLTDFNYLYNQVRGDNFIPLNIAVNKTTYNNTYFLKMHELTETTNTQINFTRDSPTPADDDAIVYNGTSGYVLYTRSGRTIDFLLQYIYRPIQEATLTTTQFKINDILLNNGQWNLDNPCSLPLELQFSTNISHPLDFHMEAKFQFLNHTIVPLVGNKEGNDHVQFLMEKELGEYDSSYSVYNYRFYRTNQLVDIDWATFNGFDIIFNEVGDYFEYTVLASGLLRVMLVSPNLINTVWFEKEGDFVTQFTTRQREISLNWLYLDPLYAGNGVLNITYNNTISSYPLSIGITTFNLDISRPGQYDINMVWQTSEEALFAWYDYSITVYRSFDVSITNATYSLNSEPFDVYIPITDTVTRQSMTQSLLNVSIQALSPSNAYLPSISQNNIHITPSRYTPVQFQFLITFQASGFENCSILYILTFVEYIGQYFRLDSSLFYQVEIESAEVKYVNTAENVIIYDFNIDKGFLLAPGDANYGEPHTFIKLSFTSTAANPSYVDDRDLLHIQLEADIGNVFNLRQFYSGLKLDFYLDLDRMLHNNVQFSLNILLSDSKIMGAVTKLIGTVQTKLFVITEFYQPNYIVRESPVGFFQSKDQLFYVDWGDTLGYYILGGFGFIVVTGFIFLIKYRNKNAREAAVNHLNNVLAHLPPIGQREKRNQLYSKIKFPKIRLSEKNEKKVLDMIKDENVPLEFRELLIANLEHQETELQKKISKSLPKRNDSDSQLQVRKNTLPYEVNLPIEMCDTKKLQVNLSIPGWTNSKFGRGVRSIFVVLIIVFLAGGIFLIINYATGFPLSKDYPAALVILLGLVLVAGLVIACYPLLDRALTPTISVQNAQKILNDLKRGIVQE
jgi:hypothetical protein